MMLMSVAERRTPCSDGPPPCRVPAVVLQGVPSLRDGTKGRVGVDKEFTVHSLLSRAPDFFLARVVNVRRGATDPL